jgi:hypothetical protein
VLFRSLGTLLILGGIIWGWQQPWFEWMFGLGVWAIMCGGFYGEILWRIGLIGRQAIRLCMRLPVRNPFPDSYVYAPVPWLISCRLGWSVYTSANRAEEHASFCKVVYRYVAIEKRRLTGDDLGTWLRVEKEETLEGARYRLLQELRKEAEEVCGRSPDYGCGTHRHPHARIVDAAFLTVARRGGVTVDGSQ